MLPASSTSCVGQCKPYSRPQGRNSSSTATARRGIFWPVAHALATSRAIRSTASAAPTTTARSLAGGGPVAAAAGPQPSCLTSAAACAGTRAAAAATPTLADVVPGSAVWNRRLVATSPWGPLVVHPVVAARAHLKPAAAAGEVAQAAAAAVPNTTSTTAVAAAEPADRSARVVSRRSAAAVMAAPDEGGVATRVCGYSDDSDGSGVGGSGGGKTEARAGERRLRRGRKGARRGDGSGEDGGNMVRSAAGAVLPDGSLATTPPGEVSGAEGVSTGGSSGGAGSDSSRTDRGARRTPSPRGARVGSAERDDASSASAGDINDAAADDVGEGVGVVGSGTSLQVAASTDSEGQGSCRVSGDRKGRDAGGKQGGGGGGRRGGSGDGGGGGRRRGGGRVDGKGSGKGAVRRGAATAAAAAAPRSLPERIQACRSMEELMALYDKTQGEAVAAAEAAAATELDASEGAAAAAMAADLSGPSGESAAAAAAAGGGLLPGTVWMFLAAAWELVAEWRQRCPAGYRTARLREARGMRSQLSRLVSEACGVVLWAERLPPAKVCLLLSLLVVCLGPGPGPGATAGPGPRGVGADGGDGAAAGVGRWGVGYPRAEQHLGLLVEDSLNSLEQYSPGEVALAASSFARLRYFPGRGWLETLFEATSGRLSEWRPIDLGFLLWSLAKWKARAPVEWLEEFYAAFQGCGQRVKERELAMVCWAIGVGAVEGGVPRPPPEFTNHLMMEVQVRLPSLGSQGLAHVAWGLCCCDVKPPAFWLREFMGAAKTTLPYASNGLVFSNLLWAFACWQGEVHPGEEWMREACKHSARHLHILDPRSLAVLLLALADLGHTPPTEWVGLALETAHRKLPATDPASAVAVLWAVSRFERQRAAAAAAEVAALEAAAAAGGG